MGGIFFMEMDFSLHEWEQYFLQVKQSWANMNEKEKNFHLINLATSQQLFIDYYADIDDFLLENSAHEDDFIAYESKGTSYYHLQMYDRAIIELEKERQLFKEHPTLLLYLGFTYLYKNRYNRAKEIFLYILHTSNLTYSHHFAYCGLGLLAIKSGNRDEAIECFEKALALTMSIDVVYNLGMCHYLEDRPQIAYPFFQEVIKHDRKDESSFYFLGKCFLMLNDKERAFETWLSGLQTVESYHLLHTLAFEFEELGYSQVAIHCYDRLRLLGYQDASIRHGIAWNYGLLDERKIAVNLFESLLSDYPSYVNGWISYLWLLHAWDNQLLLQHYYDLCKENGITHPLIEKIYSFNNV